VQSYGINEVLAFEQGMQKMLKQIEEFNYKAKSTKFKCDWLCKKECHSFSNYISLFSCLYVVMQHTESDVIWAHFFDMKTILFPLHYLIVESYD